MARARLSVLDQTPVISGQSVADAVAATVELATLADDLGFTRYWCAEHHGLLAVANPAPEVLLARLGAATKRIRLGSGGVMLPYYSPFKLAEQWSMLEALFPGRIDLGVGRAPGGDRRTAQAVAAGAYDHGEHFPEQAESLAAILSTSAASGGIVDAPEGDPTRGVLLQPAVPTRPELWMLGSSDFGGALAARLGYRFAFAHFINAHGGEHIARGYRDDFVPSARHDRPYCAVAVFAIAADSADEAADLARSVDLRRVQMAYGVNAPIPSVDEARALFDSGRIGPREQAIIERERPRAVIGPVEVVVERIVHLQRQFAANEVIVLTVAATYAARRRSYELLADAFALDAP